jgi:hypothetical protein
MNDSPYRKGDPKPDPLPSCVWYVRSWSFASSVGVIPGILTAAWIAGALISYVIFGRLAPILGRAAVAVILTIVPWSLAFLRYGRNPPSGAYVFVSGEKVL